MVLCRSDAGDAGDGGWSLHAPGSTDEQIAAGDAPAIMAGDADWDGEGWSAPTPAQCALAAALYEADRWAGDGAARAWAIAWDEYRRQQWLGPDDPDPGGKAENLPAGASWP